MTPLELRFKSNWARGQEYRIYLRDHSDFATFYQTFYLKSYDALEIDECQTVLDAGANIGTWTILASLLVGSKGKVIAVEPDFVNFGKLVSNLQLNKISNVLLFRKALWSSPNRNLKLDGKGGVARVSRDGSQTVTTETIDSLARMARCGFDRIKMDIEGSEAEAIVGGLNALRSCQRIVVEVHGRKNLDAVESILKSQGFKTHLLPHESFREALGTAFSHPLLTCKLECHNRFQTAARVVRTLSKLVPSLDKSSHDELGSLKVQSDQIDEDNFLAIVIARRH